ncbi:MAG: CoA transferase, partial [SAR202 cluster bacterium]|nr:CoA transferase [SAR202 cluster bacterium]
LLAALHHKRRTGKGQYLDLAQYESIIGTTGPTMLEYTVLGRVHPRTGNRDYYHAPQGVYPCRPMDYNGTPYEHFLAISVATDEEWRKLCQVMGRPSLAADPRFATFEARKRNEDAIDPIVAAWTQAQDAHQAMLTLQKAGVAAGVVQNPKDLLENDPQLQARDHYREVDHPEVGKVRYDGPPFALSETPVEVKPAPLLGEHNEYVFKKLLKLSDEQITEGFAQGYIA